MRKNMGRVDRVLRAFVVAPALVIGGLAASGALAVVLFVLAGVMLVTASVGSCPLYAPVGISTCSAGGKKARA